MERHEGPFVDRVMLNSAQLRCLAHPLRSRLLSALRRDGSATSAVLAKRLGTNTGATSYHLRQLAEVGLIAEDVDHGTGRERWWRASHDFTSWNVTDFEQDPDDRAAAEWIAGHYERTRSSWRTEWLASRHDYGREWRHAAGSSDVLMDLTADQLRALHDDLLAVIHRYREAGPADEGSEVLPVIALVDTFPIRDLSL